MHRFSCRLPLQKGLGLPAGQIFYSPWEIFFVSDQKNILASCSLLDRLSIEFEVLGNWTELIFEEGLEPLHSSLFLKIFTGFFAFVPS